jgi:acyl carrier protein
MPKREDIKSKLLNLIREHNLLETTDFESMLDKDLLNSGIINSMAMIRMQAIVEHDFGVTIPEDLMIGHLRTINNFIDYIANCQK